MHTKILKILLLTQIKYLTDWYRKRYSSSALHAQLYRTAPPIIETKQRIQIYAKLHGKSQLQLKWEQVQDSIETI